jgi:hypothetical protein
MKRHRHISAFTLVELLVVIAIIMILIALLIGPVMRARRQALVLACPIATRAPGGSSVLMSPRGGAELSLAPAGSHAGGAINGPDWSTNGTWIGYWSEITYNHAIVHAMTGKTRFYGDASVFNGWADDDHFICSTGAGSASSFKANFFIREAATGRVTATYASALLPTNIVIRRVPPSTDAYYITLIRHTAGQVVLLRKDFTIKKIVCVRAGNSDSASVDPMGEYAAWSGISGSHPTVAVKSLKSPSADPPFFIPLPDPSITYLSFCDWTEDGHILAAEQNPAGQKLMIITRTGKLLRTVRLDKPQFYPRASWRKYMHQ